MSDVMLLGVLNTPYNMAMSTEIARVQFHRRAQEAARRIVDLLDEIERLKTDNRHLLLAANAEATFATELKATVDTATKACQAMADDGWLLHGEEGMSDAQKQVLDVLLIPRATKKEKK